MGIHDGHRERVKDNFLRNGLSSFNDINALELLLFYAIPRKDTNELAHDLLLHFGSIDKVFKADYEELISVPGIGSSAAILIRLMSELNKKCAIAETINIVRLTNRGAAAKFLVPRFLNEKDEVFIMLCLNDRGELVSCTEVCRGDVNSVSASARKVAETALKNKATGVILAHNHPNGVAAPSGDDILTTRKIKQALELVNVELIDHMIVAGVDCVSINGTKNLIYYTNDIM